MDDRQTDISMGKGLEGSRVNQEFIDFLSKWSSPVLLTLAVAAGIWAGLQYLDRQKVARIDQAFSELASATQGGNPSPASLKTLAAEYEGVRSVSEMALLTTTDLYLNAFMIGVQPGAVPNPETGMPEDADMLDDDQRQVYLEQAGTVAQQILDRVGGVEGKELLAMQAMSRLATVQEGKRDFDGAASMYNKLASLATASQYPAVANFAQQRVENLDALKVVIPLPSKEELILLPGEDTPTLTQEQIQELLDSISDVQPDASLVTDPVEEVADESEAESEPEAEVDPATESESP
ncbi:hypothetical protein COB72_04920 [bacterium]|nr:MAG: hypothetical protein COB72_04920 [bacterium]